MLGDIARGSGDLVERTGHGGRGRDPLEEGRLRPDRQPGPHRRRRAADRDRGQGPRDVRSARCATSSARPRRTAAAAVGVVVFTPDPRPERHRPVRRPRRRRLLRRRPGRAGPGHARGGGPAGPPAGPRQHCATGRSRSTRRRSRPPSTASASSSTLIKGLKSHADLDRDERAGRRGRARPAARRRPRPARRGRGRAPPGELSRNRFDTLGDPLRDGRGGFAGATIPCYPRGPHRG